MRMFSVALGLVFLVAGGAQAHEFWIEPAEYQLAESVPVEASLVNGQKFKGSRVAYLPDRFRQFTLGLGGQVADVPGRAGDSPALHMAALGDGLHLAAYRSRMEIVTYEDFRKFAAFVEHKDFAGIKERHVARGLPLSDFREVYTRYAKSLIAVGGGQGSDRRVGFDVEIVALANPYTDDLSGGLPVQVFYGGAARADSQVQLYEKSGNGTVSVMNLRTNGKGIALLPVRSGYSYLVDSVVVREPSADLAATRDAAWESLWASLTFALP